MAASGSESSLERAQADGQVQILQADKGRSRTGTGEHADYWVADQKIVLRGVNFDFDKSNIRADAAPILREAAGILKENANVKVSVEGHTDAKGTDEYNLKLSMRRAAAVKAFLVKEGVAESQLSTRGLGESQPVASNDTEDGRAQNRRVELKVE